MWDIESSLALIRKLQPSAIPVGYNLCLCGGVLDRGFSDSDLDIVAMPGSYTEQREADLINLFLAESYTLRKTNTRHPKLKVIKFINNEGKKIDVIIPLVK